ncbi:hypothetical protein, partial [Serratia sp. CC22-02]|uniref:hypothetical protein n=1 Tax=Serratia sp. CC22-02 TaxID=1378076 RepID=UPI0024B865CB
FDYSAKGLTLRASAKALFNPAPAPVVRVRSPYLENPPMAGFCFSGQGLVIKRLLMIAISLVTTVASFYRPSLLVALNAFFSYVSHA